MNPAVVDPTEWFTEQNEMWAGNALSIQIEKVLHKEKSPYQDIVIFKSKAYGNVLVLDGVFQCTEKDEFSYHEMISHLPLFSHPNPKSVLIVGGGDGGVVREVVKHPGVEEVHLCEIDERVIELSKKYFPSISCALNSPKLTIHVKDGFKFMEEHTNQFDVIITDSPDPIGPALPLFERTYYEKTHMALKENGILCCQCGDFWFGLKQIISTVTNCRSLYPVVQYAYTTIPSYSGLIGFVLASKNKSGSFGQPTHELTDSDIKEMNLKYYNSSIHRAAFACPQFVNDALKV